MLKRFNFNISERQSRLLTEISGKMTISISELIRRILDEWLEGQDPGSSYTTKGEKNNDKTEADEK